MYDETGCTSTGCYNDNSNDNYNPPSATDASADANADTSSGNPDIVSELNEAQRALGIYEPKTYGPQPGRSPSRGGGGIFKRQSTPKHMPRSMQDLDDNVDAKEENKQQKEKNDDGDNNNVSSDTYSASRSDVDSEITMGNTTVKHFGRNRSYGDNSIIQGEDYASLFDEENNNGKNEQQQQHEKQQQPKKSSSKGSFSSMFEELKHVQKERSSLSSPYSGNDSKGHKFERKNDNSNISVSSIKKQLEKSNIKKKSVVTGSYLKSINNQANSAVTGSRVDDETLLKSCRSSGVVASLKKQFDTRDPPSGGGLSFFNQSGIQPPTPRRSQYHQAYHQAFSPRTFASDDEIREEVSTTHRTKPPTPRRNSTRSQYHQAYHQAFSPRKIASDDKIREEVSTAQVVPKDAPVPKKVPVPKKAPVMRHSTLEISTRIVAENDDNDIYLDQYEERQDHAVVNSKKKSKSKKSSKSKKRFSLFKLKSNDGDESAQRPKSPMKKLSRSLKNSGSKYKKSVQSVEGSRIKQDDRDHTINVKRTKPPADINYEA